MKYITLTITTLGAILYPYWVFNGLFENIYPAVGSAIAIYGGLFATIKLWKK